MPKGHPVFLGPYEFDSKNDALIFMSEQILEGYAPGSEITDPDHVDVVWDILRSKENMAEKLGVGFAAFTVEWSRRFEDYVRHDAKTLAIKQVNGDLVDIGYTNVIKGAGPAVHVKDALRREVLRLHDEFRFKHFEDGSSAVDEATGALIEHVGESEVRYANPTWGELTFNFAQLEGGWSAIQTESGKGAGQVGRRLESRDVAERWSEYYKEHANPVLRRRP